MRVLIIGGTHHVGRAMVEVALRRGDTVTTLNRGLSRPPAPGVEAAERGIVGTFNLAGPPGHTTIGELLETALEVIGSDAELVWAAAELLERENFLLGMEFGLRYPLNPRPTGIHDADVSAARAAGLTLRPLRETLADTWAWLQREGDPAPRPDVPSPAQWFDPAQEQHVLDLVRTAATRENI
jgi:nucleoside-diphosphate-sugar epimerase